MLAKRKTAGSYIFLQCSLLTDALAGTSKQYADH
jgi:hypothetical protein